MTVAESYGDLRRMGAAVLTTREAAARLRTSVSNASHQLRAMETAGLVRSLRRGLWTVDPDIDPFAIAHYLTAPFPAHVSFWSALARHEMIEQIPRQIFVASLDRSRRISTTVAAYSIHHLAPTVFDGYEGAEAGGYLAISEKALFDTVYVRAVRGLPVYLPELVLPAGFDEARLEDWVARLGSDRQRTLVNRGIDGVLRQAGAQ